MLYYLCIDYIMARKRFRKKGKKRRVRKNHVHKSLANSDRVYTCKIVCVNYIQNTMATTQTAANNYHLHAPTYSVTNAGTYGQMSNVPSAWTKCIALFDMYKVSKMKVTMFPVFVAVDGLDSTTNLADSYMYLDRDHDDIALLTTEALALNNGLKPITCVAGKPISRSIYPVGNMKKQWLNTSSGFPASGTAAGAYGLLLPAVNYYACIKTFCPMVAPTSHICNFFIEWTVHFKTIRYT